MALKSFKNVTFGFLQSVPTAPSFPTSGLTNYYSMDDVVGSTVNDAVGSIDLTVQQGSFTTGFHNNAWQNTKSTFGGLQAPNSSDFDLGANEAFTFSMWVKKAGLGTISLILNKERSTSPYPGYYLAINTANKMYFNIANNNSTSKIIRTMDNAFFTSTSVWYHLVFSWDGVNAAGGKIYRDSVSQSITTNFDNLSTNSPSSSQLFTFGCYWATAAYNFDGLMDEIAVYNRALTQDEIDLIYNGGSGRFY